MAKSIARVSVLGHCRLLALGALAIIGPARRAGADENSWRLRLSVADGLEVLNACEDAAAKRDPTAVAPLLTCGVATEQPAVAIACGDALRAIGATSTESSAQIAAAKASARHLKSPVPLENLARVLGAWAHPSVDSGLAELCLPSYPAAVQEEALHMCAAMGNVDVTLFPATTAAIRKGLDSPIESVRIAACDASGERRLLEVAPRLVDLVAGSSGGVDGNFAVAALEHMGWTLSIHPFVELALRKPRATTGKLGFKAIQGIAGARDVQELRALLKSQVNEARIAALLAVERMARVGTLMPVSAAPPPDPAQALLCEDVVGQVAAGSTEDVRAAARRSIISLIPIAAPAIRAQLAPWLESRDDDVVLGAIGIAGALRDATISDRLASIVLDDRSEARRTAAARAVESINAQTAAARWTDLLAAPKTPASRRLRALWALGYVRHADSLTTLVHGLAVPGVEPEVSAEIECALERLTGRRLGPHSERWTAWMARTIAPFPSMTIACDRSLARKACVASSAPGVTAATEAAVESGLLWLTRRQQPSGEFTGGAGGWVNQETRYTGYALLALLGAGYAERQGRYRETVRRAVRYLIAVQGADGSPSSHPDASVGAAVYLRMHEPLCAAALAEAVAFGHSEAAREAARAALDYLDRVQIPGGGFGGGGAWGLTWQTPANAWAMWAMAAATAANLPVPMRYRDGADIAIGAAASDPAGLEEDPTDETRVHTDSVGGHDRHLTIAASSPLPPGQRRGTTVFKDEPFTQLCVVSRYLAGWPRWHPTLVGGGNFILEHRPRWMEWAGDGHVDDLYSYWLWGSLAAHVLGGHVERTWLDVLDRALVEHQLFAPSALAGSWEADTRRQTDASIEYATVSAVLSLESAYRLPTP